MPRPVTTMLLTAALATGAVAQQVNNAGFGGVYRRVDLLAATGNRGHLGVCDIGGTLYVSARDPNLGGNHVIYAIAPSGAVSSFPQPAIHGTSPWGMRDLCSDGSVIAGGSEAGVSFLTTTGAPAATWAGQPVTQPITGAVLAQVRTIRGLAWDGAANGGNGLFYTVDHDSAIVAFNRAGMVLGTWPRNGWSGHGLALDPTSGNLWLYGSPERGDIVEIDKAGGTFAPTGRRIPALTPGARPGGLSAASADAGPHASWATRFNLAHIEQGNPDQLVVNRVHLLNGKPGWEEVRLEVSVNGSSWRTSRPYGRQDTLGLRMRDPTGTHNGLPCWIVFNLPPESHVDGDTDLTPLVPGFGLLVEHRSRNIANIQNPTTNFVVLGWSIGPDHLLTLPPGAVALSDEIRIQSLYLDLANLTTFTSSNEAWWYGSQSQKGILVEAVGPGSFDADTADGFWRVTHLGGGRPAIRSVTLDWTTSARPGHGTMVFDIDQGGMNGRHDGGNAQGASCRGTYRNGSDVTAGLDYAFPGNHRAACAAGNENSGFTFSVGDADATRDLTYRFLGTTFGPGVTFEFDCDTDGGPGVSGGAMAGLPVQVTLTDSTQLSGALVMDPRNPQRSYVILP